MTGPPAERLIEALEDAPAVGPVLTLRGGNVVDGYREPSYFDALDDAVSNSYSKRYPPSRDGRTLRQHYPTSRFAVAAALNARARKTLGWRTPIEALVEVLRFAQQDFVAMAGPGRVLPWPSLPTRNGNDGERTA